MSVTDPRVEAVAARLREIDFRLWSEEDLAVELLAAADAAAWQSMETVPRDGTRFQIAIRARHSGEIFNGGVAQYWASDNVEVLVTESSRFYADTTMFDHFGWQTLPTPPKAPQP